VRALAPQCELYNHYGPTETTVGVLTYPVRGEWPENAATLPLGRPIANARMYVLDGNLQPVPAGVPGELYVGGACVGRGYLGRPELTAERFVPDPFSEEPGARLYRTGDKVRSLPDGSLEFLGRVDFQLKVRGFRVELGEVEAALALCAGVHECVVVAREDVPGDKRLVAYVVGQPGWVLEPRALREELKQRLPEYLVPSALVVLEALPLTFNGKVDRKALPAPDVAGSGPEGDFLAPRTPTEERLAEMWCDLLGLEQVGARAHFFELGGHSLLATQAIARIRQVFQVELSLNELFEAPILERLAARVEAAMREERPVELPPLERSERTGELPLSFAQQRLWFLEQLEPGSAFYNVPMALRLSGELDVSALQRTFQELMRRHESLRTAFPAEAGQPAQVIHPPVEVPLAVVDLGAMPEKEREARRLAEEEARAPFDLARGPLFRTRLLRLSEREHVLLLTLHHIISDGWSTGVLVRETAALYEAFAQGRSSPLPELPVQYADYALWQRQWLRGEVLETQLSYWREQLEGAPHALELPTDRPRPPLQTFRGATLPVQLSRELSEALVARSQEEGVTPFMLLLAAFQTLLSRYSGQEDFCIGSPIAGRRHAETEGLIGFFVNTLVLRARTEGNPTFRELLARVKQTTLGAYAHQDIPFEKLVEELKPVRDLGRSPFFQVVLILQNAPFEDMNLPGLSLHPLEVQGQSAKFELTLALAERDGAFRGFLEYNTDLFDAAAVGRLAEHLRLLLEGVVAAPEALLSELPLLTSGERHQLLVEWSGPRAPSPQDSCLPTWFEQQVRRTPDAPALAFQDEHLTYRELNRRANRLAHHLRRLGVGPDAVVALCVERSLEMVVGLLGILKAGAAYLPLDPSYPRERLAFMCEDSGARVLVTRRSDAGQLPEPRAAVVLLEGAEALADERDDDPVPQSSPDNLAYVIYTSGSTGRP
ncbi:MAG: condensation domain-containing protein, partial [Archangium sp.]